MALLQVGFNEGSLLRRTLVHVGTFVLGSIAFVGLMSFILVSVAQGLLPRPDAAQDTAAEQAESGSSTKTGKAAVKTPLTKKTPSSSEPSTTKDD